MALESVHIGLNAEQHRKVAGALNKLLADESLLYIKSRNYHWNVTGPRFAPLHSFFEGQYDKLEEIIDDVAENVRQFGGVALGTMSEYLAAARLQEQPGAVPDENGMLANLLADHEAVIRGIREDINALSDVAEAADFLTGVLEEHNKMAWMLRAHLRG